MPEESAKIAIPKLKNEEIIRAASGLAVRAKTRFLEGAPQEAKQLLAHAKAIIAGLDEEVEKGIVELEKTIEKILAPTPSPAKTG